MSIAAVILAAGASQRLGRPKQTVEIHGETLLARAVRIAREAKLFPVLTVIADPALTEPLEALGAVVLLNPNASEGIASSIRTGITAAAGGARDHAVAGAVLMACDQVALTASHLRALCTHPESTAGSLYAGATGIPAYFPSSAFADLLQLHGDRGARALLSHAHSIPMETLSLDIDTEQDLRRACELFENK